MCFVFVFVISIFTLVCADSLLFCFSCDTSQLLTEQDETDATKRSAAIERRRKKARQAAEGNNDAIETALCRTEASLEEDLTSFSNCTSSTAKVRSTLTPSLCIIYFISHSLSLHYLSYFS